jgi:hypothetical protein
MLAIRKACSIAIFIIFISEMYSAQPQFTQFEIILHQLASSGVLSSSPLTPAQVRQFFSHDIHTSPENALGLLG